MYSHNSPNACCWLMMQLYVQVVAIIGRGSCSSIIGCLVMHGGRVHKCPLPTSTSFLLWFYLPPDCLFSCCSCKAGLCGRQSGTGLVLQYCVGYSAGLFKRKWGHLIVRGPNGMLVKTTENNGPKV